VFKYRSSRRGPELIAADDAGFTSRVEPVTRVQCVVFQELITRAVKRVRTAFGNDLNLRARIPSKFSVEIVSNELEFLDRIEAQGSESRSTGGGDIGCNDSVDRDVVPASAPAIRIEAAGSQKWICRGNRNDSGRECRQHHGIARRERQFFHPL